MYGDCCPDVGFLEKCSPSMDMCIQVLNRYLYIMASYTKQILSQRSVSQEVCDLLEEFEILPVAY